MVESAVVQLMARVTGCVVRLSSKWSFVSPVFQLNMDVHQALSFVNRVLTRMGESPLRDLEEKVFIGSWAEMTYREVHPPNPEYIEKCVAFHLWKKLSNALGEKVTKKRLKAVVLRAMAEMKKVFVSYRGRDLDRSLANQLYQFLESTGRQPFASNLDAIASLSNQASPVELGETDGFRRSCDCFILLASESVARSEVAIEELRQLRYWRSEDGRAMPILITILINTQFSQFSHDLRHYLQGAVVWKWISQNDTPMIVDHIHKLLEQGTIPMSPGSGSADHCTSPITALPINLPVDGPVDAPVGGPVDSLTDVPIDGPVEAVGASTGIYPLPTAEPEVPKGLVRLASTFYVERNPSEVQCYSAVNQPGALIRIKAPRQMGKTSLMARILDYSREQGCRAIPLSFQHADRATFSNLGSLLRWFCMKVAHKLRLPHRLDELWVDTFGSKDNCTYYFEEYLLPEIQEPLVLGLDEVDCVFQYPIIADDFFGLLRAWYEEASYGGDGCELWEKLRLVVVHSTEVYIPLDVNQSPFNVGLPIELREFSPEQVFALAYRHNLDWTTDHVKTLMTLVGGHPYLIRLALYYIAKQQTTLEELCKTAPTESGIYDDHLRRHFWHLDQHPDLASAYHVVLKSDHPVELDSERAFKLHSLGLVNFQGNGVVPSFDLYRQYFGDRLQPLTLSSSEP